MLCLSNGFDLTSKPRKTAARVNRDASKIAGCNLKPDPDKVLLSGRQNQNFHRVVNRVTKCKHSQFDSKSNAKNSKPSGLCQRLHRMQSTASAFVSAKMAGGGLDSQLDPHFEHKHLRTSNTSRSTTGRLRDSGTLALASKNVHSDYQKQS